MELRISILFAYQCSARFCIFTYSGPCVHPRGIEGGDSHPAFMVRLEIRAPLRHASARPRAEKVVVTKGGRI